jgi:hypothetical protein
MSEEEVGVAVWKPIKKVRLMPDATSEHHVFDINDLTKGKIYDVHEIVMKVFPDGTREPCYQIKNDNNILILKSISKFQIIE